MLCVIILAMHIFEKKLCIFSYSIILLIRWSVMIALIIHTNFECLLFNHNILYRHTQHNLMLKFLSAFRLSTLTVRTRIYPDRCSVSGNCKREGFCITWYGVYMLYIRGLRTLYARLIEPAVDMLDLALVPGAGFRHGCSCGPNHQNNIHMSKVNKFTFDMWMLVWCFKLMSRGFHWNLYISLPSPVWLPVFILLAPHS